MGELETMLCIGYLAIDWLPSVQHHIDHIEVAVAVHDAQAADARPYRAAGVAYRGLERLLVFFAQETEEAVATATGDGGESEGQHASCRRRNLGDGRVVSHERPDRGQVDTDPHRDVEGGVALGGRCDLPRVCAASDEHLDDGSVSCKHRRDKHGCEPLADCEPRLVALARHVDIRAAVE